MKEKKDYTQEMEFIRDWCLVILDFLKEKDANFKEFAEITKNTFLNNSIVNNKKMLIGYRQGFRDINEMTQALSENNFQELNQILAKKFGKTILDFDTKKEKKISSIIKRRKISSDEEYELIENKVSELSQEEGKDKEIELMNKLLIDYLKK